MKIKCLKLKCTCGKEGLAQAFLNKSGQVRYARVRHYLKLDSETKKPVFEYHRLENLAEIETQLKTKGLLTSVENGTAGQVGQAQRFGSLDPQLRGCAPVQQNKAWASSSVRILESCCQVAGTWALWLRPDRAPAS